MTHNHKREALMAPWRLEFIKRKKERGCFFCEASRLKTSDQKAWKECLLLYRDKNALAMLNKYPYIGGHLLISPHRHTSDYPRISEAEERSLWRLARRCVTILQKVMKPDGFNMGMNLGKAGGAGVEDHLHLHVLPRWIGDTNFLPVVGQTHSIPVALEELWTELRPAFKGKST